MKLFVTIVLLGIAASALAGPPPHRFERGPQFMECVEKSGFEMKDVKDIMKQLEAGEELDADLQNKVGCAVKCVMEKNGVWKDGGIDIAAVEEKMSEFPKNDHGTEAIQECSAKKAADDCETAYQIMMCMKSKFPRPPPA